MNVNSNANGGASNRSRLIEQAAVTFLRDCTQRGKAHCSISRERERERERKEYIGPGETLIDDIIVLVGILDADELSLVKTGLLSLASSAP